MGFMSSARSRAELVTQLRLQSASSQSCTHVVNKEADAIQVCRAAHALVDTCRTLSHQLLQTWVKLAQNRFEFMRDQWQCSVMAVAITLDA